MTDPNVPPVDPTNEPAQVPPVEPEEDDDELDPEGDPLPPPNETAEQKDARLAALEDRNAKLWARLQREKNKGKPASPAAPAPAAPAATPSLSRDEAILIAKGLSEDEVEHAKKVAALQGVKLTEAINDDLYTGWKEKKDKEAKAQAAQLPASRGSRATVKKSFNTPGLSTEDHKALFNERLGK